MSPPILFRSWATFSDSLKLHLSALLAADTFLTKRHNTNNFLPPSLNIALWVQAESFLVSCGHNAYSKIDHINQDITCFRFNFKVDYLSRNVILCPHTIPSTILWVSVRQNCPYHFECLSNAIKRISKGF